MGRRWRNSQGYKVGYWSRVELWSRERLSRNLRVSWDLQSLQTRVRTKGRSCFRSREKSLEFNNKLLISISNINLKVKVDYIIKVIM